MKKRNGWKWTLALTIWFAVSTVTLLSSTMYDEVRRWPIAAAITAVFAALTVWLRSNAKKAEREYADAQKAREDAERKRHEEIEATLEAHRKRFKLVSFAAAGVTFKNDDKTERQKILREIALNEGGQTDTWLKEDASQGEDAGVQILTDVGCVGYIRRSDKAMVREIMAHDKAPLWLSVEQFTNDDGDSIYRADVVFSFDRESPIDKWFFDDLPEQ